MRLSGIVCEYNPLHDGHFKQLSFVKKQSDFVICVMSGSFVQRGEPAMFDKFIRTEWALCAGADAVFEIPAAAVEQSAQGYADASIRLLASLGVDDVWFGSETESIDALIPLATLYRSEPEQFTQAFQSALKRGLSYPAARQAAAEHCLGSLPKTVFSPNATLGIHYINANHRLGSPLTLHALPRTPGVSGAGLRRSIMANEPIKDVPAFVSQTISGLQPVDINSLSQAILYRLRCMSIQQIGRLPDISEGFENRLSSAAGQATGVSSLLSLAATRRYPVSRIKRILMQALLCIDSSIVQSLRENGPGYARLLGLRVGAEKLLGELQQRATIPIVSRPAKHKDNDCFAVDIRATDLHALAAGLPAGLDFTRAIVRV